MKNIYCVIREETHSEYTYIEAESKEKAEEIANTLDSESWRSNQDYNSEITEIDIIKDKNELKGRYVETEEGSYRFGDKNKEI